MVCEREGQGWRVILQRQHGLMSAKLLAEWSAPRRLEPWFELLNACAQHDHGWDELADDGWIDEQGAPLDFLHMPAWAMRSITERNLAAAHLQSRWSEALMARHAETLCSLKDDPDLRTLGQEVQQRRERLQADLGVTPEHLESLYELLCWADSLSLMLCCGPGPFASSLQLRAQGQHFEARAITSWLWQLRPWPFDAASLRIPVETRRLESVTFGSPQALREALARAPLRIVSYELVPG